MWQGRERRSPESRLARAVVAAKAEADEQAEELRQVPRRRFRRRREMADALEELRDQERKLVTELGGRNGSAG
jgi:hypothetical protein